MRKAENCKVAVYTCPLDSMQTETKVGIREEFGGILGSSTPWVWD